MGRFELWFLRRVAKKEVIQGGHQYRIRKMYEVIIDAARIEFNEDNRPTLDGFLEDCHKDALHYTREIK